MDLSEKDLKEKKRLKIYNQKYYLRNKEWITKRNKVWQSNNRDKTAKIKKNYIMRNPERYKEQRKKQNKKYSENNKDKIIKSRRKCYLKNKDKRLEIGRAHV